MLHVKSTKWFFALARSFQDLSRLDHWASPPNRFCFGSEHAEVFHLSSFNVRKRKIQQEHHKSCWENPEGLRRLKMAEGFWNALPVAVWMPKKEDLKFLKEGLKYINKQKPRCCQFLVIPPKRCLELHLISSLAQKTKHDKYTTKSEPYRTYLICYFWAIHRSLSLAPIEKAA